jgi:hypothetical protein
LKSSVELLSVKSLEQKLPDELFDMVMVRGVLNHAKHPLLFLEQCAKLAKKRLVIATIVDAQEDPKPVIVYYGDDSKPGYPKSGFGFNFLFFQSFPHTRQSRVK